MNPLKYIYLKKISGISPRMLLVFTAIMIFIISLTIYFEYQQRQQDYLNLLDKQAASYTRSITRATQRVMRTTRRADDIINRRILANLRIIERFERNVRLTEKQAKNLIDATDIDVLQVYDENRNLFIHSFKDSLGKDIRLPKNIVQLETSEIFTDTLLVMPNQQDSKDIHVVALVPRQRGGLLAAIVLKGNNINRKESKGIDYFLNKFQADKNIEYVVIQNREKIVAGSHTGFKLLSFSQDPFLENVLDENQITSRTLKYGNIRIFESFRPFVLDDETIGILRLGMSMQEYNHLLKDVNTRYFVLFAMLFIIGVIYVNFWISYTQKTSLRQDLQQYKDYTFTILENLQSGVIAISKDGTIQAINKQALQLLGASSSDLLQKAYTTLPFPIFSLLEHCLQSDGENGSEIKKWLPGRKKRKRLYSLKTRSIKDAGGEQACILLFDDITNQVRLEDQIRRNQRLKSMRNLASSVAHEIKNPLNSIKLLVEFIKKKYQPNSDSDKYYRHLDTIQGEIDRISLIVEQYLHFSRPPGFKLSNVNFVDLFATVAHLFESDLKEKNITLSQALENHHVIRGDESQLKQVIINLMKNAIEAIEPPGEIFISGKPVNNSYEIEISDTGPGIPENEIPMIFDLYFTTKENGTGIGLSVVNQIVALHQGKIYVESEPEKGTTFILQFPLNNGKK